jgi:RNA polymerase sigma factor (sigma-70 family)
VSEPIRVDWEPGCPFFLLVEKLTAQAARFWSGDPTTEALAYVWKAVSSVYVKGSVVNLGDDRRLRTIVRRKVSNFYRYRHEKPLCGRAGWASLGETEEAKLFDYRVKPPDIESEDRELIAVIEAAIDDLSPRQRDAVRSALEFVGVPTVNELARLWGTTSANVRKHAKKAVDALRKSSDRFA